MRHAPIAPAFEKTVYGLDVSIAPLTAPLLQNFSILAGKLPTNKDTLWVVSRARRTFETMLAHAYAKKLTLPLPPLKQNLINEQYWGTWTGQSHAKLITLDSNFNALQLRKHGWEKLTPPSDEQRPSESFSTFITRAQTGLNAIANFAAITGKNTLFASPMAVLFVQGLR